MTDVERHWSRALQEVVGRGAHEMKDALNGVSLNLEVVRSRLARPGAGGTTLNLGEFAEAAVDQLEKLTDRTEALLFLARAPKAADDGVDVAEIGRHLAALLVPATKAGGGNLRIEGFERPARARAPALAVRLALAEGMLALATVGGNGRCVLEAGDGTVVRFSHESAAAGLQPAVVEALAGHGIRAAQSGKDLLLKFPGI